MKVRDLYEFGPYRLDASARVLLRDGAVVPLTPKALEILAVLVKDPQGGRVAMLTGVNIS